MDGPPKQFQILTQFDYDEAKEEFLQALNVDVLFDGQPNTTI